MITSASRDVSKTAIGTFFSVFFDALQAVGFLFRSIFVHKTFLLEISYLAIDHKPFMRLERQIVSRQIQGKPGKRAGGL
ncbi:hypothetical protein [Mesorhizobium sp. SP-1A]|uniref:hypothetical protein n=1 Tax=Mesorhizobium sp. SP-1A TaxID=3077840 RepID=UPI0028F7114B|nr:hypothetical protein [Mesorhizobium sp. SP-1A]